MRKTLLCLTLLGVAVPAAAQERETRSDRFMRSCDRWNGDRDRESFCEIRDAAVKVPQRALFVDGRENGGVAFYGWDKNEILVKALIQTTADSRADAEALAKSITIETDGDRIRARGPLNRRYSSWSVSYEVWVPRKLDLDADTHNGGVTVEGVEGRMELRAVNGGISLREVAGDIRAHTTNGGVGASLDGTTWRGQGLDLQTTNGSVSLDIPRGYSAELETGTVNGGMNIDFPVTVQGFIGRRITTKLGNGGPRVRATTTNGSVRIREK